MLFVLLVIMEIPDHLFFTCFCRSDAGDIDEADKFYKKAAVLREPCKGLLSDIVNASLGNANMSDEGLNNLLLKSEIFKELCTMGINGNTDRAVWMLGKYNLLTYVGNAR